MGLTIDQMFPSRFIKATDFGGKPVTLTIAAVEMEELEREDGTERAAAIVSFKETKRQLVLNRTNALSVAAMFDRDTDEWLGKRVTFLPERDSSPVNDTGWCIRVKGSPDITATITVTIKLPRRKPVARKLIKTTVGPQEHTYDDEPAVKPAPYVPDAHEQEKGYPAGVFDEDAPVQGGFDDLSDA